MGKNLLQSQQNYPVKFKYLGVTYTVDKQTYDSCINKGTPRRLFSIANSNDPHPHNQYFHIMSSSDGFFCAHSKDKKPKYRGVKHKTYKNLSKTQCKYLKTLALECQDFRGAIKITKEAIESIFEIS